MEKYKNRKWLNQKYSTEKLNTYQIAELCNCSYETIRRWLIKFNISIRSLTETKHLRYINKIGNSNYCNKKWLRQKYSVEKLSVKKISKLCNCSGKTIWNWLRKLNIVTRSINEATHSARANHCDLSSEARQWIDGELLGDGNLQSKSKYSAGFKYGSKYKEYIQYVSNVLSDFGIKQSGKIRKQYNEGMNCCAYHYQSLSYVELLPIRNRWYPEGKKIIPRDLKLTPLLLRQEMIGDGSLEHCKNGRPRIRLSTNGFSVSDVEWFVEELNKLGFKSTRHPNNNSVYISAYSTKEFLDYIGKSPVDCYQYKWKY